jgi:hypothetical protein
LPLLTFVRCTPRQYEAEWLTDGDLLAQTMQQRQAAGDRQGLRSLGQQTCEGLGGPRTNALGPAARPGVAHHDGLQPQPMGRVLTHPVRTCAHAIPHGPLSLWVDIPCRQQPRRMTWAHQRAAA